MPDEPEIKNTPLCPYCADPLGKVSSHGPVQLGQLFLMIIFCGNLKCRKIWTLLPMAEQKRVVAPPHPFIVQ